MMRYIYLYIEHMLFTWGLIREQEQVLTLKLPLNRETRIRPGTCRVFLAAVYIGGWVYGWIGGKMLGQRGGEQRAESRERRWERGVIV
jgi:hypothetical protein